MNLCFSSFIFLLSFSWVALASPHADESMISSLDYKRGYKKTGLGQRKSSIQGGQGGAAWKGAFILAVASCESENISSFTGMDTCK